MPGVLSAPKSPSVAAALGLAPSSEAAVALEGNLPCTDSILERWRGLIALELGCLPGGYGWVFPKGLLKDTLAPASSF